MNKYDPLHRFLRKQAHTRVPTSFAQVESIIGAHLPTSARSHRAWWANDASGHIHAKAWLDAGYETADVDMEAQQLVFKRVSRKPGAGAAGMAEPRKAFAPGQTGAGRHPMIGALKGLLWIEPGLDLTQPALPSEEWEEIQKAKYGDEPVR